MLGKFEVGFVDLNIFRFFGLYLLWGIFYNSLYLSVFSSNY